MSNLNGIPSADYFETKLANTWNGTTGTVYVDEVPSASMPVGEYSYIVVNPGESNMQVAKIDGWDSDNKTFNVTDVVIDSGAGTQYTAKTHPLGALVRFSNNYAFWKDIQTAVNTKADDSDISAVGKSNDYNDLDNLPTFATVATSGDYDDLINTPTPITIAVGDKVLQLSGSNVLSATVSASYDSGTKKITLYGANSAVISEIDCTAFIKDGMIQDVKIVTDPVGYAPGKYLEFDFNTDSGISDIYIALSDLAVYTAGEGISISSNAVSVVAATASTLGGIKVGSGLTINSGTLSADSQTDENYTTAEKTKLAGIEAGAEVNKIAKVQVNGTDLPISSKTVNVKIKTINGTAVAGEGDIDIMARQYTEGTGISIDEHDEISISTAYQTAIANKAEKSEIPTNTSDLYNDSGYIAGISSGDVTTALGYIPYNSSNPNGYTSNTGDVVGPAGATDGHLAVFDTATGKLLKDGGAVPTVPTNVSDFVNDAGYITGIDSGDVTTALGYTPADSANLGTAAACDTGTGSGDVPVLDSNGKLATSTLPGVALTDTFTVSTSADLTTLSSADQGDIAIVTSENKTYVLSVAPYSTAANWKQILSPTGGVTSVNTQTGAVVLDADDISDSTTTNKFVTASDKTTWNGKQNALATQTAYTSKGTSTKVATITTNTLGQVTAVSETSIAFPVTSVNGSTGAVSLSIPTKTSDLNNDSGFLTSSNGVTSFNGSVGAVTYTAPVTSVNGSTGAVTVQETLVNQTNIKSINNNSLLGSGDLALYSTISVTLTTAGWSSSTQTVTATGVTSSNTVIISPAPASIADYVDGGVYASAQGTNSLTFTCDTTPSNDITVNVVILN